MRATQRGYADLGPRITHRKQRAPASTPRRSTPTVRISPAVAQMPTRPETPESPKAKRPRHEPVASTQAFSVCLPQILRSGAGCALALPEVLQQLGLRKPMLVTDAFIMKTGMLLPIEDALVAAGCETVPARPCAHCPPLACLRERENTSCWPRVRHTDSLVPPDPSAVDRPALFSGAVPDPTTDSIAEGLALWAASAVDERCALPVVDGHIKY